MGCWGPPKRTPAKTHTPGMGIYFIYLFLVKNFTISGMSRPSLSSVWTSAQLSSSVNESSSESPVSVDRAELESFSGEETVPRSREKPKLLSVLGKNCFNFGRSVSLSDSSTLNGESSNTANVQAKEDEEEKTVNASNLKTFTVQELAAATKNFRPECLLCKGRIGHYYKGRLESTGRVVVVKKFDMDGFRGQREFLTEFLMLSHLHHPNIVNLIGHCADRDERLLAYEFMPLGSLKDHLHDLPPNKEPLDWTTRMKIAAGAARGLEYLHDRATPPVIYKNFKSSNILLDEGYHSKLSDFGLAKLGPNDETPLSTRVMGSYGYCAPEYAMTGQLSTKADIYSVGVVLLELITGRKAIDNTRSPGEHHLVAWARPLFKDRRNYSRMADPLLQGCYPMRSLSQALAAAAMCLQKQAASRPPIADLVTALTYIASKGYDPDGSSTQNHRGGPSTSRENGKQNRQEEVGHSGRSHGSPSHHRQDSSAYRGEMGSGSRKKWS